jgi:hypothetical protein
MALAVDWDTDFVEAVVWYYDVDMAADENLIEEEMDLGCTEELDLASLVSSSTTKPSA